MKKKSSSLVIVVVAVIVAVLAFTLPKLMSQKEEVSVSAETGEKDVQNLSESEDLVIPLDKVTNNVTFYAVDHLPAHLAVLDRWSRELFGRPAGLRQQPLARQIEALAAQTAPADCDLSQFVRIVVPASGDPAFRLESAGISLYRGYDLRSLMPDAVTLQYDMPFPEAPTSAREAAAGLARQQARLHGASVAVRCDGDGIVRTADNAPLFAVRGKTAFVSPAEACVEQELGLRAVEAAGLELEERPVMRDELPRFDELFYVDHRGVTALAHCDGHPCMAILAERVAQSLGGLFPKM